MITHNTQNFEVKMNQKVEKLLNDLPPYTTCANLINLENLKKNYKIEQDIVGNNVICAGVVKANAYGFGADVVAKELVKEGCKNFFVATVDEGMDVRNSIRGENASIFVLGGVFKNTEHYFTEYDLTPVIVNFEQLKRWANFARTISKKLDCVIHIDTGMIRNGFLINEVENLSMSSELQYLNIKLIMSHLACADEPENLMNTEQLEKFKKATSFFPGIKRSLSSTNGMFLGKKFHFDLVRPGKALYGFAVRSDYIGTFHPVSKLYSRILQINTVAKGQSIGYGATFTTHRKTKTATIGIGYADGFMRKYSGHGCVYIGGQKVFVVGRVSMDYCVVDITDLPENVVSVGDWATIADDANTLEKFALDNDSLPHEIMCKLGPRVKKIYL